MEPIPLPAPYGGVNELIPVIALESPYCENLLNFNATQAGLELKKGDSKYKIISSSNFQPLSLGVYADGSSSVLFALVFNSTSGFVELINVGGSSTAYTSAVVTIYDTIVPVSFSGYLFFFFNDSTNKGVTWDGSTGGVVGYTGTGLTPAGGCVFKTRLYIAQYAEPAYWYTKSSQVTGAITKVDLSTVVSQKAELLVIAKVTLSDGLQTTDLLALCFSSGEILFYSGSYPDSDSWTIVGRGNVGRPLWYNSGVPYQGDYLLFVDSGVISLRDLFLRGSEQAANKSINTAIGKTWIALITAYRVSVAKPYAPVPGVVGVVDQKNKRVIVSFPGYVDSNGSYSDGNFQFIYNTDLQSWYFHRNYGVGSTKTIGLASFQNDVYFSVYSTTKLMVYKKEGSTEFIDRNPGDTADVAYDYEIKSAPVANSRSYAQKVGGLDVIVNSDLHAQTNYYLIKDFGVTTTSAQKVNAVSGSIQKANVNIGIDGSYVQFKISGTTTSGKTVGYKLYGVNIWTETGRSPR